MKQLGEVMTTTVTAEEEGRKAKEDMTEQHKARKERGRTGQEGTWKKRAGQGRREQSEPGQDRIEKWRIGQGRVTQVGVAELGKEGPGRQEKIQPGRTMKDRADVGRTEQGRVR